MTFRIHISLYVCALVLGASAFLAAIAYAQSDEIEDLTNQIEDASSEIDDIDAQIEADKKKLEELEDQKDSLEKTITNLRYSENRLERDIITTNSEISTTDSELKTLAEQITDLEDAISVNKQYILETISEMNKEQERSFWEIFLVFDTFSEFFDRLARFETTGKVLRERIVTFGENKDQLEGKTVEQEEKRDELVVLTEELADKKEVVAITKQQQQQVLTETKNTEQVYQQTLAEKLELRRQFEQALLELESQLQIAIDKSLYAGKSTGLFSWPVSNFRITQFFGNTSFAASGAYNGRGHSGTDFAVPIGTPVRAVMDGTVWSSFDTDAVGARGSDGVYRACVSYGKYVLIKHDNGLSTLYAHNSLLKVKNGDRVSRGDIIAYSGNSGYSTGPHLHFSTYATQGVQVQRLGDVSSTTFYCANSVIPIISLNAYLDPYDYLPRPRFSVAQASYGESGAHVRSIQMMLKHERIFPIEVSANGYYGDQTTAAVKAWQKKYGLGDTDGREFDEHSVNRYLQLF